MFKFFLQSLKPVIGLIIHKTILMKDFSYPPKVQSGSKDQNWPSHAQTVLKARCLNGMTNCLFNF